MCKIASRYDPAKTGKRIRERRKEIAKSQDEFLRLTADKLKASRSSLSKWENGEGDLTVWELLELCNIFDCDPGHLLCEYEEKKGVVANIHAEIGLTEDTIMSLREITQEPPQIKEAVYTFLDDLLDDMEFIKLAIAYKKYKDGLYHGSRFYSIVDETGDFVDLVDGDIAMIVLKNSFNRIINCASIGKKSEFGRSEQRKYWKSLTDKERENILAQAELDLKHGK